MGSKHKSGLVGGRRLWVVHMRPEGWNSLMIAMTEMMYPDNLPSGAIISPLDMI